MSELKGLQGRDARVTREWLAACQRAAMLLMRRYWTTLRFRIGSAIIGGKYRGMVMRLWLIRDRAQDCITPDGQVILAKCEPLAEALYEPMPGLWSITVEQVESPRPTPENDA